MQASAGLGWAPPPSSASQAPRQPPLALGGVFVPPLSAAAPSVAAASYPDPRLAPPPPVDATGWSSTYVPPPQFSSAPPGTPHDSESEDSDSGSSSASAALDSAAVQLVDLVYGFCPETILLLLLGEVSSLGLTPSPASSSSRPRYHVYPRVAAVESEVADRAAALHRHSKPLSAVLPRKICHYAVWGSAAFCGPAAVESAILPSCGHRGHGVQALGLRYVCGDGVSGEVIPVSAGGDVFIPLDDVRNPRHVEA